MLLPMLAAVIVDAAGGYTPLGDEALIDLHVRDLLALHLPLVGPYSRYGWNHPGPALYFALAPFSAVTGGAPWATMAGGAILQGIAVVLLARLAWRRGGLALLLAASAALALAYSTKPTAVLLEPWSPYVLYPFFLLFALEVWAAVTGAPGQIVAATVVGSFLVQTHVGYAPFVVAGALFFAGLVAVDKWRGTLPDVRWTRVFAWTGVAAAVMWVLPLFEEVEHYPGNLSRIFDYFVGGKGAGIGITRAAGALAGDYRLPFTWIVPEHRTLDIVPEVSTAWLLVPLALLVLGAVATRRSRVAGDGRLVGLAALLAAAGLVAFSGVVPPVWAYLVMWRVPLAAFVVLASMWAIARWAGVGRRPRASRATAIALAAVIVWCSVGLALRVAQHGRPVVAWDESPPALAEQIARGTPHRGAVLVTQIGGFLTGVDKGLVIALDRLGVDARPDARISSAEVANGATTPAHVPSVWYLLMQPWVVGAYTSRPGAQLLARVTPLSPAREAEISRLQDWLVSALVRRNHPELTGFADDTRVAKLKSRVPGLDQRKLRRLAALNAEVARAPLCRCSVVSVPSAEADH